MCEPSSDSRTGCDVLAKSARTAAAVFALEEKTYVLEPGKRARGFLIFVHSLSPLQVLWRRLHVFPLVLAVHGLQQLHLREQPRHAVERAKYAVGGGVLGVVGVGGGGGGGKGGGETIEAHGGWLSQEERTTKNRLGG